MEWKTEYARFLCLAAVSACISFLFTGCATFDNGLNLSYLRNGGPETAQITSEELAGFVSSIRPGSGRADTHYRLACFYQRRARHEEAIAEFRKAIILNPRHLPAINGMAVSLDAQGNFVMALRAYKKALRLNPAGDYVYNNLGYSCLLRGDVDTAIVVLREAVSLNNRAKRYHNNLGIAYAMNGEPELAMTELTIGGGKEAALRNMARLRAGKHRFGTAAEGRQAGNAHSTAEASAGQQDLQKALLISQESGSAVDERSRISGNAEARYSVCVGNFPSRKEAIMTYLQVIEIAPDSKILPDAQRYGVYCGVFRKAKEADSLRQKLLFKGYEDAEVETLPEISYGLPVSPVRKEVLSPASAGGQTSAFLLPEQGNTAPRSLSGSQDSERKTSNKKGLCQMAKKIGSCIFKKPFLWIAKSRLIGKIRSLLTPSGSAVHAPAMAHEKQKDFPDRGIIKDSTLRLNHFRTVCA